MKATEQLKEEHQGVLLAISILEKINELLIRSKDRNFELLSKDNGKLKKGEDVNPKHLEQLLEFIRVFVDKCHHGKEEDLLFPAMEKTGVPNEGGPIGMMLEEHDLGRNYVKDFAKSLEEYKKGNKGAASKIVKSTSGYIALLKDHIDKEDNILYMIADAHLSPKIQKELLKEFDKVEEEKIGKGKHEQFHKMLESLSKIY